MDFLRAQKADEGRVMELYRRAMGTEGCTWNETYPTMEHVKGDRTREALFCLKTEGGALAGVVSIDEDPLVEELECWTKELQPSAELARLAVQPEYQNQRIAGELLTYGMQELKKQGYRSVHFLVSKTNERALRAYAKLDFSNVGESGLFGENWWCYEKEL